MYLKELGVVKAVHDADLVLDFLLLLRLPTPHELGRKNLATFVLLVLDLENYAESAHCKKGRWLKVQKRKL